MAENIVPLIGIVLKILIVLLILRKWNSLFLLFYLLLLSRRLLLFKFLSDSFLFVSLVDFLLFPLFNDCLFALDWTEYKHMILYSLVFNSISLVDYPLLLGFYFISHHFCYH